MSWYIYLVSVWLIACFICAIIAAVTSKSAWGRVAIVLALCVGLIATFTSPFELLGRAKPAAWAWLERKTKEAEIHGAVMKENEGIYLLLIVENEPRLYVFPWNQKLAENIQQAMTDAEAQGTVAVLGQPFQGGGPLGQIADAIEGLFGAGEGQGGQQGQGQEGQQGQMGEGGNFSNSVEERDAPFAYPKPREALPPKPPQNQGVIFDRPDDE